MSPATRRLLGDAITAYDDLTTRIRAALDGIAAEDHDSPDAIAYVDHLRVQRERVAERVVGYADLAA